VSTDANVMFFVLQRVPGFVQRRVRYESFRHNLQKLKRQSLLFMLWKANYIVN